MAVKSSTGLRNALMVTASFKATMDSCNVRIYSGAVPPTADAPSGTLLCILTNNNDGTTPLTFEAAAANGVLQKSATESWAGTNTATGTATYYRLELAADDQSQSDVHPRVQGVVGIAGADMNLTDVGLVQNATTNIDYYSIVLPTV